jgi:hypothetical protein
VFSIYNAYSRQNPYFILLRPNEIFYDGSWKKSTGYRFPFPIIPVTLNLNSKRLVLPKLFKGVDGLTNKIFGIWSSSVN